MRRAGSSPGARERGRRWGNVRAGRWYRCAGALADALARQPWGGQPRADFADGRNRLNREGAARRSEDFAPDDSAHDRSPAFAGCPSSRQCLPTGRIFRQKAKVLRRIRAGLTPAEHSRSRARTRHGAGRPHRSPTQHWRSPDGHSHASRRRDPSRTKALHPRPAARAGHVRRRHRGAADRRPGAAALARGRRVPDLGRPVLLRHRLDPAVARRHPLVRGAAAGDDGRDLRQRRPDGVDRADKSRARTAPG